MTSRRRAAFQPAPGSGGGGGGGGPAPTALVEWGPDFGEANGPDDNTTSLGMAQEAIEEVGLTNDAATGSALDMDLLALDGATGTGVTHDFQTLGLAGDMTFGPRSGSNDISSGPREQFSYVDISYLHYSKQPAFSGAGVINPDQDSPTVGRGVVASRSSNNYTPIGLPANEVVINAPTPLLNDERVALWRFPLSTWDTEHGWLTNGVSSATTAYITFTCHVTNAAATDVDITCDFRYGSSPWGTSLSLWSWNNTGGGNPSGTRIALDTRSMSSGGSGYLSFTGVDRNSLNIINNNHIWVRLTTTAPRLLPVTIRAAHDSGLPNDNPGDFKAGILGIRMAL